KLSTPCATAPTVADSTATLASAAKSTPLVTRFLPDLVARAVLRRGRMSGYHRDRWRPRDTGEWGDESRAVSKSAPAIKNLARNREFYATRVFPTGAARTRRASADRAWTSARHGRVATKQTLVSRFRSSQARPLSELRNRKDTNSLCFQCRSPIGIRGPPHRGLPHDDLARDAGRRNGGPHRRGGGGGTGGADPRGGAPQRGAGRGRRRRARQHGGGAPP